MNKPEYKNPIKGNPVCQNNFSRMLIDTDAL